MNGIAATQFLALSTPTAVSWLAYIIIGGIAGWLASKVVRGGGSGILIDIVVGVIGGYIGGTLLSWLNIDVEQGAGGLPSSPLCSGRSFCYSSCGCYVAPSNANPLQP